MSTRKLDVQIVGLVIGLAILVLLAGLVSAPGKEARAQDQGRDPSQPVTTYHLKVDGIEGESKNDAHPGEIEVLSWSWGATNSTNAVRPGSGGKVSMQDFTFRTLIDKSTPMLFLRAADGDVIRSATLTGRRDGRVFLEWELKNVVVASFKTMDEAGVPANQIGLAFKKIIVTYTPLNADGSAGQPVTAGWDLAKGTKV